MRCNTRNWMKGTGAALATALLACSISHSARAVDSLCARVRIQINQEASLERQAFDAKLRINNPLDTIALQDIGVSVLFYDADGTAVKASSDPNDLTALFFITVDSMDGISDIGGNGTVAAKTSGEIHWLIIPAPGAGGATAAGTQYSIGARIAYSVNGQTNEFEAIPDTIVVKPMPKLKLDYFIPNNVYGDDAFTDMIEPTVPFNLGVRVQNNGYGPANNMQIASSQPKIVENAQGLLIGFQITGTSVNDAPAALTLNASLGTIAPGKASVGRWVMETSLSGRFTEFSAYCTHADELGGQMTSLMESIATHFLVHDVLVDLPGRDGVRDFLAKDGDVLRVYESDYADTLVLDRSADAGCSGPSGTGLIRFYTITVPYTVGPVYVAKQLGNCDQRRVISAVRSNGKTLSTANVWLSKTRDPGNSPWRHYLNLFDANGGGTYTIAVEDISGLAQSPVQEYIADPRLGQVGKPMGFMVHASDINGRLESQSALPLPATAEYRSTINGALAEGIFLWTPQPGQEGTHHINFSVSDGVLSDAQNVTIIVGAASETTNEHGILPSQQIERFVVSRDQDLVGTSTGMFVTADGASAPVDLRVQCLVAPAAATGLFKRIAAGLDAATYPPPTTNGVGMSVVDGTDAPGYFVPTPAREHNIRAVRMGMDAAFTGAADTGMPGFVSACIAATNEDYYGWLRAFSASDITNAAYYGDTCMSNTVLATPNEMNCAWTPNNPRIAIVNPAYHIPFIGEPGTDQDMVTGRVAAIAGGGENMLAAEWLVAEYRLAGGTAWQTLTTNFQADGRFVAILNAPVYPTNAWIRVRIADDKSPRPGLPISEAYPVDVVPEPALLALLLAMIAAWRGARRR